MPARPAGPRRCARRSRRSSRTASAMASAAAEDPACSAMLRERGTVLEVCPSSNLNTRVLAQHRRGAPRRPCPRRRTTCASRSAPTGPRCCAPTCATSSTCSCATRSSRSRRSSARIEVGGGGELPRPRADDRDVGRRPPRGPPGRCADPRRGRRLGSYTAGRVLDLAAGPRASARPQPDGRRRPSRRRGVRLRWRDCAVPRRPGAYVVVVCATRGWFDARLYEAAAGARRQEPRRQARRRSTWRNLDTVREDELRRSVAVLGVRVVRMLDYAEGELDRANFDQLVGRIVEPIRMHRPEVILSFGPDGVTGDTDHVVLSRAVRAAFDARGRAARVRGRHRGGPGRLARREALRARGARSRGRVARGAAAARRGTARGRARPWRSSSASSRSSSWRPSRRHVSQTGSAGPFHDWGARCATRGSAPSTTGWRRPPCPSRPAAEASLFDGLP